MSSSCCSMPPKKSGVEGGDSDLEEQAKVTAEVERLRQSVLDIIEDRSDT